MHLPIFDLLLHLLLISKKMKCSFCRHYQHRCYITLHKTSHKSSHQRCSMKKGVLRGLQLVLRCLQGIVRGLQGVLPGLRPATLLKRRLWYRCFPTNFVKFLKTLFLQNTSGQLLLKPKHGLSQTCIF